MIASPGRTVSGIQKKLLAVRDGRHGFRAAPAEGPAPFIAKFNSEAIPTLVRNEALSLRWAAAVLGASEVTAFTTGFVAPLDEPALVVTCFDRSPRGEPLRLEDCAQILCKPRGAGFAGKYDAAYEDVAAVIRRFSVRPAIDLARFFRRLVVFALVGNCDAHLKNFSLLETAAGLRLSPAYDVVNTAIYERFDRTLALSLSGRKWQLDELAAGDLHCVRAGDRAGGPGGGADPRRSSQAGPRSSRDHYAAAGRTAGWFRLAVRGDRKRIMPENSGGLNWSVLVAEARRRRKAERLTQREHAALAGVSIPTIAAFDRGETSLTLAKAFDILRVVGLVEEADAGGAQEAFVRAAVARWQDLAAGAVASRGWYRFDYCLEGPLRSVELASFETILQGVAARAGGRLWAADGPVVEADGAIECGAPGGDFWRAGPDGRLFLARRFEEDRQETFPPGVVFDVTLPIWRMAEALLHAAGLATVLAKDGPLGVLVRFRAVYNGLNGRVLRSWANPLIDLLVEGQAAGGDEAVLEVLAPAEQIEAGLSGCVHPLAASLFERFGVTGLSAGRVGVEIERMLNRWD